MVFPFMQSAEDLCNLTQEINNNVPGSGNYHMAEMKGGTFKMVGALPGKDFDGHKRVVSYNIGSFIKDNIIGKGRGFIYRH